MPDLEHLTRLIAGHLPAWIADVKEFGHTYLHHQEQNWRLKLKISYRDTGRIIATGLFDQDGWWYYLVSEQSPKITVAISRGPATIAQEIERRLLPKYIALYERIEAADHKRQAALNAEIDALDLIAEITHGDTPHQPSRTPRSSGDLRVRFGQYNTFTWPQGSAGRFYQGRLNLELNRLTPQEAALILEMLIAERTKTNDHHLRNPPRQR